MCVVVFNKITEYVEHGVHGGLGGYGAKKDEKLRYQVSVRSSYTSALVISFCFHTV